MGNSGRRRRPLQIGPGSVLLGGEPVLRQRGLRGQCGNGRLGMLLGERAQELKQAVKIGFRQSSEFLVDEFALAHVRPTFHHMAGVRRQIRSGKVRRRRPGGPIQLANFEPLLTRLRLQVTYFQRRLADSGLDYARGDLSHSFKRELSTARFR